MSFQLEDCALQLCRRDSGHDDFGIYLDLDSALNEQSEELEGFADK